VTALHEGSADGDAPDGGELMGVEEIFAELVEHSIILLPCRRFDGGAQA
tara:strand:- start:97 stop:243 length:147 start_codon:yes stop_codon:yes gene_type:complete